MNAEQAAALRELVDRKGTRFSGTGDRRDLVNIVDRFGKVHLDDPRIEYLRHHGSRTH